MFDFLNKNIKFNIVCYEKIAFFQFLIFDQSFKNKICWFFSTIDWNEALFLYCVDQWITWTIVLHALIYICSSYKENSHQNNPFCPWYTALSFQLCSSLNENECDEIASKTCRLVDTKYHRLLLKLNVFHILLQL